MIPESCPGRSPPDRRGVIPSGLVRFCNAMSDSARAQVVGTLMNGNALPASLIANALRMSPQATRFHLRVLEDAGLVVVRPCGRHRYYEIASADTAERLESIFGIVAPPISTVQRAGVTHEFAEARCCYKHLAGMIAVDIANALQVNDCLSQDSEQFRLEAKGQELFARLGIIRAWDLCGVVTTKRCIDVTHRRAHLGGSLGASLFTWMLEKDWLRRTGTRALFIPSRGRTEIRQFIRSIGE